MFEVLLEGKKQKNRILMKIIAQKVARLEKVSYFCTRNRETMAG